MSPAEFSQRLTDIERRIRDADIRLAAVQRKFAANGQELREAREQLRSIFGTVFGDSLFGRGSGTGGGSYLYMAHFVGCSGVDVAGALVYSGTTLLGTTNGSGRLNWTSGLSTMNVTVVHGGYGYVTVATAASSYPVDYDLTAPSSFTSFRWCVNDCTDSIPYYGRTRCDDQYSTQWSDSTPSGPSYNHLGAPGTRILIDLRRVSGDIKLFVGVYNPSLTTLFASGSYAPATLTCTPFAATFDVGGTSVGTIGYPSGSTIIAITYDPWPNWLTPPVDFTGTTLTLADGRTVTLDADGYGQAVFSAPARQRMSDGKASNLVSAGNLDFTVTFRVQSENNPNSDSPTWPTYRPRLTLSFASASSYPVEDAVTTGTGTHTIGTTTGTSLSTSYATGPAHADWTLSSLSPATLVFPAVLTGSYAFDE